MAPAMLCKICKKSKHGEPRSKTNDFKSKFACILEASEYTRKRVEESLPKYQEDHIAGKGDNSQHHYNLAHKFIPVLQAMKIPAAKAAVDKEWEKLEKVPAWVKTKVRNKSKVIDEARNKGIKVRFCLTDGHLSFEECRIGDKAPKIRRSSCTPRRHCERWFWILCSIYRTRIISITNDGSKCRAWISYPDCQDAQDKQLTQYLLIPRSIKTEDAPKFLKIPKSECPDIWIRLPRHEWPKSWSSMADPVVLLERNLYGHSFGRTNVGKAIWENPIEIRMGEGFQLGMLIRTPWKRIILICVCAWHQIGWKETKSWSDVESTQ